MEDTLSVWERRKSAAKVLGVAWVESALKDFVSPQRAGVPRGNRIGLAASKRKAAYFMILYPHAMTMSEIAREGKTTAEALWVYRTRPVFTELVEEALEKFPVHLQNTLAHALTNSNLQPRLEISGLGPNPHVALLSLIPFFADQVYTTVLTWMTAEITKNNLAYIPPLFDLIKFSAFQRDKGLKGWARNPKVIGVIKHNIQLVTALIGDRRLKKDELKNLAYAVQGMTFEVLDALTQKKSRKKKGEAAL